MTDLYTGLFDRCVGRRLIENKALLCEGEDKHPFAGLAACKLCTVLFIYLFIYLLLLQLLLLLLLLLLLSSSSLLTFCAERYHQLVRVCARECVCMGGGGGKLLLTFFVVGCFQFGHAGTRD